MTYPHNPLESEKDDQRELVREPRSAKSWAEAKERCVVDYPTLAEIEALFGPAPMDRHYRSSSTRTSPLPRSIRTARPHRLRFSRPAP